MNNLLEAEQSGLKGLIAENAAWRKKLCDQRENGRIFDGSQDFAREQIPKIIASWTAPHSSSSKPDPRRFEASGPYYSYGDSASWHGLPCYNELYFTHIAVRNQCDRLDYYPNLISHWLDTFVTNAREVFGLPGMFHGHGYLPPIRADGVYPHTIYTWEFCMEIPAQVMKHAWDIFDYGGDEEYLAEQVYPGLRELAVFSTAYAKKGDDDYYHVIPSLASERWGWTYRFERNRDSTAALAMFKWTLLRAAQAAEILGVDAELRKTWRQIAAKMAPYPTYRTGEGTVFTDVRDGNPLGKKFSCAAGVIPTVLADEINLDSGSEQKEIVLRTARLTKSWFHGLAFHLLADGCDSTNRQLILTQPERLINSRSAVIHLFPCVPEDFTIAFKRLLARGGFAVSAEMISGSTTYVRIESRRGAECRLMNPWPMKTVRLRRNGSIADELTGSLLEFKTAEAEEIVVIPNN